MPKDTFFRLNEEKKKRIFDAAVHEFSAQRFKDASLNKIIKAANIPWGSFYQYFEGKEDLYLYMFGKIAEEKHEIVYNAESFDMDADIFTLSMEAARASFEWARMKPEYCRIGMLMYADDLDFIVRIRNELINEVRKLIERDKKRGVIRPDADSDLIVDLIYSLFLYEYFSSGFDEKLYFAKMKEAIKIIREGIAVI
ncbi:MAG: TetR/AcrR family transcriptional regulator [Bacillota bacterium]|nr:TetR/AcrR family transcriptional regulator [Bacillota bacterium]